MTKQAYCNGDFIQTLEGTLQCSGDWVFIEAGTFAVSDIDPVVASGFFAAGFAVVITPMAVGFGVKMMLSLLR